MPISEIYYYSDGLKIAGYIAKPEDWEEGDPLRPGILFLPGYSGNAKNDLSHLMERLAAEGWFCFGMDYRGFGASEGERGRHRPLEQAQDAYDALTYMQTMAGIDPDRIGLLGTSFGGANAIWVAAHDERVKCVVTTVAVTHGERWLKSIRRPWEWLAFKDMVDADARSRVQTGKGSKIPIAEIVIRDPHSNSVRKGESFGIELDLQSAEAACRYRPEWVVGRISPRPVLFIYSELDALVPPQEQISCYEKCGEPKRLVKLPKATHYDCYEFVNPEMSAVVRQEAIAWFRKYL